MSDKPKLTVDPAEADVFVYPFEPHPNPTEYEAGRDAVLAAGNRLTADGTDAALISYGLMAGAINFYLRAHHPGPNPPEPPYQGAFNTPAKRLAALHALVYDYASEELSPDFHAKHDEPSATGPTCCNCKRHMPLMSFIKLNPDRTRGEFTDLCDDCRWGGALSGVRP